MRQELIERFNIYGVTVDEDMSSIELASHLAENDVDTLRSILGDFSDGDIDLELDGDDHEQCMTMSYALVSALREDRDYITPEDLESAQIEIMEGLDYSEPEAEEEPEQEASEEASDDDAETLEEPRITIKSEVYALVQAEPELQKHEVVKRIHADHPDWLEGSIVQQYYKARGEFNLKPVGKRGRPAGQSKVPQIRAKIEDNPNMSREDIINWSVNELDLKESTAINYYGKANQEINGES